VDRTVYRAHPTGPWLGYGSGVPSKRHGEARAVSGMFVEWTPNDRAEGRRDPGLRRLRLVFRPEQGPTARRPVEELHAPPARLRCEGRSGPIL